MLLGELLGAFLGDEDTWVTVLQNNENVFEGDLEEAKQFAEVHQKIVKGFLWDDMLIVNC